MSTLREQIDLVYPESDGQPMADNTLQYDWIVKIKENLEEMLPNDFIAADLLWYPVEGDPTTKIAPDVMVALGRPKGHRRSYKQWEEAGLAPQVVFEILSPCNTALEMMRKERFYTRYGVSEYYVYDPDARELLGYVREQNVLRPIENIAGWVSPLLGIRFETGGEELEIFFPDGRRFLSIEELRHALAREQSRADEERKRADEERKRADEEHKRAEKLAERLRAMGVDPESI